VVNVETGASESWSLFGKPPAFAAMLSSYSSIAIARYNFETVMLLRESFERLTREVQQNRCAGGNISTEPGACGDIRFYLIEVKFDALQDEEEREYFKSLPTSFKLKSKVVDKLRNASHRILSKSKEFQRFMNDLR